MSDNQAGSHQGNAGGNDPEAVRIPRRTPMACQFCRGRKLKCDGRTTCANCERRNIPCIYVPVSDQPK
ncbi:hypothetical protein BXZ70DRAFT_1013039 [Cristinia sonorae]|uniref:Zn(2)-C6 fungal-type domain-containing protein n=1 Tax=Cristinia sonorae TaxID=1940300 RepID=A0A8K0UD19_9AGAR|nr:hypothetical protein BXZ70DRAFT_1013039 [Cristinia sonorae]